MPRAIDGSKRKDHRKKILKLAKGFRGRRGTSFKAAKDAVVKSLTHAYESRRDKKNDMRSIWITRLNAAVREEGISYSRFIDGLTKAGVIINRKALSNMAIEDPAAFKVVVATSKKLWEFDMLNLDQVRLLENRVEKAVGKIQSLTAENAHLRTQLSGLQTRVGELEGLVRSFKDDQGRIEEGILNALDRLGAFEDSVFNGDAKTAINPSSEPEVIPEAESPESAIQESEVSGQIEIEAEWQSPQTPASTDGQMDIF